MINCEIYRGCVISQILRTEVPTNPAGNPSDECVQLTRITGVTFQIKCARLYYVLVVTFSINNNMKLSKSLKQEFKKTISGNKHGSKITTQSKHNNLDYMTDPKYLNFENFVCSLIKIR